MSCGPVGALRVWRMVRKELRQLFRDPRTKRVMFASTVIQLLLFGYAYQRRSQRSQLWRLKMSHPAGGDEPQIVAASRRLHVRLG